MSQHTPGPWTRRPAQDTADTGLVWDIITDESSPTFIASTHGGLEDGEQDGNSAVLAAAPDLLAALLDAQWSVYLRGEHWCPVCMNRETDGHMDDCSIGRALKRATLQSAPVPR